MMEFYVIESNTKEIRDKLRSLGYRYDLIWPLEECGNIIAIDQVNKKFSTWKSIEYFNGLVKTLNDQFNGDHKVINFKQDIIKFYEEARKKV